jgi:hypothetical protein
LKYPCLGVCGAKVNFKQRTKKLSYWIIDSYWFTGSFRTPQFLSGVEEEIYVARHELRSAN